MTDPLRIVELTITRPGRRAVTAAWVWVDVTQSWHPVPLS